MKERISLYFSETEPPLLDRVLLEVTDDHGVTRRALSIRDALAHPAGPSFRWARGIKALCLTLLRLRLTVGKPLGSLLLSGFTSSVAATLDNLVHKAEGMLWLHEMLCVSASDDVRARLQGWFERQNSQGNNKDRPIRVFAGKGARALSGSNVLVWINDRLGTETELLRLESQLATLLKEQPWTEGAARVSGSLPATDPLVIGRENELRMIGAALEKGFRIFQIVGPGGRGKTALANKWADELKKAGRFERIFLWSFYRQGYTSSSVQPLWAFRSTLAAALGVVLPPAASAREMVSLLAQGLSKEPTLLVLDGVEGLLQASGAEEGVLRDDVLPKFLEILAETEGSFCLLTSRTSIANLSEARTTRLDLEPLSRDSTRRLLREFGVGGLPQDLEAAVTFTEGHPLLIRLLAARLQRQQDHPHLALGRLLQELRSVSRWADRWMQDDPGLTRMLRSYARELAGTPELSLLKLSAVFDRLPEEAAILMLLKGLRRLASHFTAWESLCLDRWREAAAKLRRLGLAHANPETTSLVLEMHPLVQGFFAAELRREEPEAYRAAHRLLYEHFCAVPEKQRPDTLEEMEPLFRAIYHGCQGGLYQRAFDEVAYPRLSRELDAYILTELGAYQDVLALMSCFCEREWSFPPDSDLTPARRGAVLQAVAHARRVEEKLDEAIELMRRSARWLRKGGDLVLFSGACFHTVRMATTRGRLRLALLMCARLQYMALRHPEFAARVPATPLERDFAAFGMSNLAYFLLLVDRKKEAEALLTKALRFIRVDTPEALVLPGLSAPFHSSWLIETGQNEILLAAIEAGQLDFSIRKYEFNNSAALVKGRAWTEQAIQTGAQPDATHRAKTIGTLNEAVQQAQNFGRWVLLADALLARAHWLGTFGEEDEFGRDANQCREISREHGFMLHLADLALLETARSLRRQDVTTATKSLRQASQLVHKHGYKLRYRQVKDYEKVLKKIAG